jgi:hypothetical protein
MSADSYFMNSHQPDEARESGRGPSMIWPENQPKTSVLPDALTLARLVSNVTEIACGATFAPADSAARGQSICSRMVLIPIRGERDISVVLSCDGAGGQALGAALRACPSNQLTPSMIDDAIAELLNMVAGQIQTALDIDQPLGLPRPTSLAEMSQRAGVRFEDAILLTSKGLSDLNLWIFETVTISEETPPTQPQTPTSFSRKFRSLFRKAG